MLYTSLGKIVIMVVVVKKVGVIVVFANLVFLYIFLPLNLLLYFGTKNKTFRNNVLIAFSLIFYSWGEPVWIILLIFSATIDFFHGLAIERFRGTIGAKLAVVSSLTLNLGLLGIFKYSGFIVENLNAFIGFNLPIPQFTLPIGISFYTFQTISYVIDVYRGDVKPQHSYGKFLMFVSLYHQLVAGPIVRYSVIADEINDRSISIADINQGITRFCIGLSKKVLVANVAGDFVVTYMDGDLTKLSVGGAWFGALMFMIQIYFDFSGYSDMAIGLGRIFGFHYDENFNYPYIAKSVTDFWRRWHISLSSFFRDYVYIPMGGNRRHQLLNIAVVWFLTGLWHGASWNFILWGVYYGFIIMLEKLFLLKVLDKLPSMVRHIYLLFIVVMGWVLFYHVDTANLMYYLKAMFGATGNALWDINLQINILNNVWWLIIAIVFSTPVVPKIKKLVKSMPESKQLTVTYLISVMNIVILIACTAMLVGQSFNPFLYFRF